jgi:hypothetical protein
MTAPLPLPVPVEPIAVIPDRVGIRVIPRGWAPGAALVVPRPRGSAAAA